MIAASPVFPLPSDTVIVPAAALAKAIVTVRAVVRDTALIETGVPSAKTPKAPAV